MRKVTKFKTKSKYAVYHVQYNKISRVDQVKKRKEMYIYINNTVNIYYYRLVEKITSRDDEKSIFKLNI